MGATRARTARGPFRGCASFRPSAPTASLASSAISHWSRKPSPLGDTRSSSSAAIRPRCGVLRGSGVAHLPAARTHEVTAGFPHRTPADLIHVHMTAAEWAAVLAWPVVRAPLVTTRHFAARRGGSVAARFGSLAVRRRLAVQISISNFVAGAVGEPTETLLNGVADDEPVDPVERVVLVAQRLEPEKRTTEALDAWVASGLEEDGWKLVIAGDGSERPQLEAAVTQAGFATSHSSDAVSDLSEHRRRAGIFLATAPREPFGLSVAEAMAAGLPVVACGAGGHLETVGAARPDLLYRPGAPNDCAAILSRLSKDPEQRRQAGADLRAYQQRFLGIDRHVDALRRPLLRRTRISGSPGLEPQRRRLTVAEIRPVVVFPRRAPVVAWSVWRSRRCDFSRQDTRRLSLAIRSKANADKPRIHHVIPAAPGLGGGWPPTRGVPGECGPLPPQRARNRHDLPTG